MRVMLDPEAIAHRDSFTMLFWGSMLSGVGNSSPLVLVGAGATVVVVVALTRLRSAATDGPYRWHLGLAIGAACVSVFGSVVDALPLPDSDVVRLLAGVTVLAGVVHWIAVIRAMSRLTDLWDVDQLRQQWSRAFRWVAACGILLLAMLASAVVTENARTSPFDRQGEGELILLFVASMVVALVAFVQYLVAIWRMRSATDRAARVPVPA